MTLTWPAALKPRVVEAHIEPRAVGGVPAINGGMQWVQSDAGCWYISFPNVPLITATAIKAWRALAAFLNGPTTPILVPVFDCFRTPFPPGSDHSTVVYHSDLSPFSDGTGYSQGVIDITTIDGADARATSLNITVNSDVDLDAGIYFSIGERLYMITTLENISGDTWLMSFMPPLREGVSGGESLNFDNPVCRCILADNFGMPAALDGWKIGHPSVSFIEDFS